LNNNASANKQAAPTNQFNKNNSTFDRRNERKSFGTKGYPILRLAFWLATQT
jgi:hypothetical protein